ncbi:MAG: hypothetical protein NZ802_08325 [Candidatus Poseidoniales archaeon]|nr:hypothetical protein [Candidatus Poseidoniales archaeon]
MEPESADSPDAEEHAEEFSEVLEDLIDDFEQRKSRVEPAPIVDSESSEFADIIDEDAVRRARIKRTIGGILIFILCIRFEMM